MVQRNGQNIARAPLNKFDDGSLLYAGSVHEGEEVRFAIGNAEDIIKNSENICQDICKKNIPESIFVYSCMARRRLLGSQSSREFSSMVKNTNVSGFFTYGEFYSNKHHNHLLNETMTLLTLSESSVEEEVMKPFNDEEDKQSSNTIMPYAITHMTNVIAKEWQERLDIEIAKNKEQERQEFQKNKLVQMGEMISMIAHQWRQPLNAISASSINLSLLASMDMLENKKVEESSTFVQEQCQQMSSTIDTFMNFVKPAKESRIFQLEHAVDAIMQIMGTQLINHNIKVDIKVIEKSVSLVGYEDLLEQVIINLLANARDAFSSIEGYDKYINITISKKNNIPIILIEDNAGGVPKDVQEKIFNPYFTTKEQGKGTGIGLYMSLDIMRKSFNGDIKYHALKDGSSFEILCGNGDTTV
jgi:C4-dicarboxylate-specific signal transduction histidine kinase